MFDLIFPTYCLNCGRSGEYLCTECQKKLERSIPECYICRRISNRYVTHDQCNYYGINSLFVGWRYNTVARKIISQFKYKYSYSLAEIISELFIKRIKETGFVNQMDKGSLLIPMPIHKKHFLDRGFNQSLLIAENIAKEFSLQIINDVLYRTGSSKYQAKSTVEERRNLKDIFYLKKELLNKNIIILDDVITTGATINNAAKLLKGNNIKVLTLFRGKPRYLQ
ncbi:MAG: ComF family protein [Candidatus Dojkabacteria bacterium]|nr:ComF family protein [Candidatus Dojkabacteria bacterium]